MKGQKGRKTALGAVLALLLAGGSVHSQSFSSGKNLHELSRAVSRPSGSEKIFLPSFSRTQPTPGAAALKKQPDDIVSSPVFLPRWSAECLPFFCRIEHDVARKGAVNFKFRLGSVDYVDWLEGKGESVGYPGQ